GRGDVQDIAAEFFRDTPSGEGQGAIESAVEDDGDNRLKGIRRQRARARREVSGGVVHQRIDVVPVLVGSGRGGFDGVVLPDVACGVSGRAAIVVNLFAGLFEGFFAASDEEEPRPELGEVQGHGAAEASAATGQKDGAAFEKIGLKHGGTTFRNEIVSGYSAAAAQAAGTVRWQGNSPKKRRGGDLVPPRRRAR